MPLVRVDVVPMRLGGTDQALLRLSQNSLLVATVLDIERDACYLRDRDLRVFITTIATQHEAPAFMPCIEELYTSPHVSDRCSANFPLTRPATLPAHSVAGEPPSSSRSAFDLALNHSEEPP